MYMGYAIELSFDVRKEGAWHSQLNSRKNLAEEYGCAMQYFTHEIEGKGKNEAEKVYMNLYNTDTESV